MGPEGAKPSKIDLPSAIVAPDGSFEITTRSRGKGAPVGLYIVTVSWTGPSPAGDSDGENLLPQRYLSPLTANLPLVEVKEGNNDLPPFELTR
jgi:hypothetical protein